MRVVILTGNSVNQSRVFPEFCRAKVPVYFEIRQNGIKIAIFDGLSMSFRQSTIQLLLTSFQRS
jgi:hypothetical protein